MKHKAFIIFSIILLFSSIGIVYLLNNKSVFLSDVYINEVMSDNESYMTDHDGDYHDWIEIYNPSNLDVNLQGYYLTDDEFKLIKWKFPKNSIIPAQGYRVIFASGKNTIRANGELHTNFKISSYGEKLLLVAPDKKTIIDEVNLQRIGINSSFGRVEDGSNKWKVYGKSFVTPNNSNQNAMFVPIVNFSHESGFYQKPFTLELSSLENATIYYTLDGSIPTTNSYVYKEGIFIDELIKEKTLSKEFSNLISWYQPRDNVKSGMVVRAFAVKDGIKSDVITKTYFVDENLSAEETIPTVSFSTNKEFLLDEEIGLFYSDKNKRNYYERGKAWEREGHLEFFNENKELAFSQEVAYRIHGGASRSAPNKALRIYSRSDTGTFEYQFFSEKEISTFNSFILRNGGSDWQHVPFRDALLQSLIKDSTDVDIQYFQPVRLFINGEYWGLYFIRDRFDADYLYNHYGAKEIDMASEVYNTEYGNIDDYLRLRDFLRKETLNTKANYEFVKSKLDVENFADYSIAQIYYMNVDQPGKNVKIWRTKEAFESEYKQTDGRWRYMLFDTDMSFYYNERGNFYSPYDRNGLIYNTGLDYFGSNKVNPRDTLPTFAPNYPHSTFMLRRMLEFDEFRYYFINRFADLLNTAFLEEIVHNKIATFEEKIMPYMEEHIARWNRPSKDSLVEDVRLMKEFALNRPKYMRQHIIDFFALKGTVEISLETNNESGNIKINSLLIDENTLGVSDEIWSGIYFKDVPVEISAQPKAGYQFKKWISNNEKINDSRDKTLKLKIDEDTFIQAIYEIADEEVILEEYQEKPSILPHIITFLALFVVVGGYIIVNKIRY